MSLEESRERQRQTAKMRRSWETRRQNLQPDHETFCVCDRPQPMNDEFWLTVHNTVQCGQCGRAVFRDDGQQVHSLEEPNAQ